MDSVSRVHVLRIPVLGGWTTVMSEGLHIHHS